MTFSKGKVLADIGCSPRYPIGDSGMVIETLWATSTLDTHDINKGNYTHAWYQADYYDDDAAYFSNTRLVWYSR